MDKNEALKLALEDLICKAGMLPIMQGICYVMHPEALQAVIDEAIKQALAAPVQDEHQAFIDSLPKDGDDKMFMQIDHWAHESYKRHKTSVRGQAITAADGYESHIIWATLRWVKENTPPAQPAVPDALTSADIQEHIEYVAGWNDCRQAMLEMMK
jgi:2,4-dienoyl-CoA reductase-like NADH-dependent reductase (Old Yellow Enzyme family)